MKNVKPTECESNTEEETIAEEIQTIKEFMNRLQLGLADKISGLQSAYRALDRVESDSDKGKIGAEIVDSLKGFGETLHGLTSQGFVIDGVIMRQRSV